MTTFPNDDDAESVIDVIPSRAGRKLCVRHKQMANQNIYQKLQKVSRLSPCPGVAWSELMVAVELGQSADVGALCCDAPVVDVLECAACEEEVDPRGDPDHVLLVCDAVNRETSS